MQRVLLTGSSGRIGQVFFAAYQHKYKFVLSDIKEPTYSIPANHKFIQTDLSQAATIDKLSYICFGDDPWIEDVEFSASEYAKIKIKEVLKG